MPAARAASSIGPDRRVSRPIRKGLPFWPSTRAAARPRARTSSGVSSVLATPRRPSVPNRSVMKGLALGVLRRLAGLLQAVLLALLLPRVAGQEAGLLQRGPHLGVELDQAPGDAEAQRTRLAGDAAAGDGGVDVVDLGRGRDPQRLADDHAMGLGGEVLLDRPAVDHDLPGAGPDADTGDGLLAAAGGLGEGDGHAVLRVGRQRSWRRASARSRGWGCWAA